MIIIWVFGAALSLTSVCVTMIYTGYTNYNWAKSRSGKFLSRMNRM